MRHGLPLKHFVGETSNWIIIFQKKLYIYIYIYIYTYIYHTSEVSGQIDYFQMRIGVVNQKSIWWIYSDWCPCRYVGFAMLPKELMTTFPCVLQIYHVQLRGGTQFFKQFLGILIMSLAISNWKDLTSQWWYQTCFMFGIWVWLGTW